MKKIINSLRTSEEEIREVIANSLYAGSWVSLGAGETCAEVYSTLLVDDPYDDEPTEAFVGEIFGDNGCNRLYNPDGESWSESIEDHPEFIDTVLSRLSDRELRLAIESYRMWKDLR